LASAAAAAALGVVVSPVFADASFHRVDMIYKISKQRGQA
jgi:hypothetical protein